MGTRICELRWLKDDTIVQARRFETFNEAQRDVHQLFSFYRDKLGATRAEVWEEDRLRYFRGL